MQNILEQKIWQIIEYPLEEMGYNIVRIKLSESKNKVLQIMIEHQNGAAITVDDCQKVSYFLSALLDVEDPIQGNYNLEISSPGIDRPLVRLKDFQKHQGLMVRIKLTESIQTMRGNLKKIYGRIDDICTNNLQNGSDYAHKGSA